MPAITAAELLVDVDVDQLGAAGAR